jgi:integrase
MEPELDLGYPESPKSQQKSQQSVGWAGGDMPGSKRLMSGKDTWQLRVYLGRDSNGRVKHLHRTFRGSGRAADRELARLVTEQDLKPAPVEDEPSQWGPKTTVNDAITAWKENGWQDLSPKTTLGYESIWNRSVKESIGTRRISSLNSYDVEKFFRGLKAQGNGPSTVRQVRALLSRACKLARKWSGGTLPNPIAEAELPTWKMDERPAEVRSPELAEVQMILEAARNHDERFGAYVRIVAATGMRRGEACGLRWTDIDFQGAKVKIDESVISADGGAVVKSPKTRASIRTVALDDDTIAVLRQLRKSQAQFAKACSVPLDEEGFAFSFEPGGGVPPHPDTMTQLFAKVRKGACVASDIHLHSLRHFQATSLDPVLPEKQKQVRLGWSTVHMARHYTDAIGAEDRKAADHMGQLLSSEVLND